MLSYICGNKLKQFSGAIRIHIFLVAVQGLFTVVRYLNV